MKVEATHQQFTLRGTAMLAAGLLIAGNAFAASNVICDKTSRSLAASDAVRLTAEKVDHVPHVVSLDSGESLDVADMSVEPARPLTEVSSQAESMFDHIFDTEDLADASESSSPIAETSNGDGADSAIRNAELEISPEILPIRAEMFRKDI